MLRGFVEELSGFRLDAQEIEIIPCDLIAGDADGCVMPVQYAMRVGVDGSYPAESGVALPKILKRRIGSCEQMSDYPTLVAKLVEALRITDVKRLQHNCIQHPEDNNVGANSEHQSNNRHEGECGGLAQHAQSIAKIE